jgi:hypothetical protein
MEKRSELWYLEYKAVRCVEMVVWLLPRVHIGRKLAGPLCTTI